MKHTGRFVSGLLVAGMMLPLANSLAAQSSQQSSAKVVNIKGSARYMMGHGTWHPLKVGAVLKPGAIVQTASGSYADIVLYNESATASGVSSSGAAPLMNASYNAQARVEQDAVRIFENTVLGINKLTSAQTGADRVT